MATVFRVFQLKVCAEELIEYFPGFLSRPLSIGFGLFDTDNLTAFGAFSEEMTGAIHFVLGAKPTHVGQFWFLHAAVSPLRNARLRLGCRERKCVAHTAACTREERHFAMWWFRFPTLARF
jgi:hypothetical protein